MNMVSNRIGPTQTNTHICRTVNHGQADAANQLHATYAQKKRLCRLCGNPPPEAELKKKNDERDELQTEFSRSALSQTTPNPPTTRNPTTQRWQCARRTRQSPPAFKAGTHAYRATQTDTESDGALKRLFKIGCCVAFSCPGGACN